MATVTLKYTWKKVTVYKIRDNSLKKYKSE